MKNSHEVPELTNGEFESFTKKGLVLIDFFAEWCMPCVMMGPVVEELSQKFNGKIKFGKVNVGDNQALAQKFNVRSIPNFILFKDGKQAENFIGSMPAEEFQEKLKKFL
jgi:thioredoxin 1